MATRIIGIEMGSSTIKLAVCSGGTVIQTAVEPIPKDLIRKGRVASPAAMSSFLRKLCKKHGIRPGPCGLVLPGELVISHHITMPLMSDGELMLNLPYEFRDFTGKNSAAYDYDYAVTRIQDNRMELFAAAVPRDAVAEYVAILKKAGMTLKIAIPAEMAWLNLIRRAEDAPGTLCIVDVGHRTTRVNIFAEGSFAMGRDIDIGGALLEQLAGDSAAGLNRAYETLAFEVMKVITFFRYSDTGSTPLKALYFTGGSCVTQPLRAALLQTTGMEERFCSQLISPLSDPGGDVRYWALAAGAALQPE